MTTQRLHIERFAETKVRLPGAALPWLARLREEGLERYVAKGVPTPKLESWHFTNIVSLSKAALAPAVGAGVSKPDLAGLVLPAPARVLVFVDGRFRSDLSRPGAALQGVRLMALSEALAREPAAIQRHLGAAADGALSGLNAAYMSDGAVVVLDSGVTLKEPIQVLHLVTVPASYHLRHVIVLGEGASASLCESYAGPPAVYWTNAVANVSLAANATLFHAKRQGEGADAFHTARTEADMAAGARYNSFVLQTGGKIARNEIVAVLDGENAATSLLGVALGRGRQHVDNTTEIIHAAPRCSSDERYRSVLDGESRSAFQGRIVVKPGAQKTNAHQRNDNLLLSRRAEADTKPELEIHADDVKCGHGATVGELDAAALFYLRTRGIGLEAARAMLVEAFVSELVEEVPEPLIRAHLAGALGAWLPGALAEAA
jgi:Fe-S cluster assembly protein SufD